MSDIAIKVEGLGKKYVIGHESENGRYTTLRDVVMHNARSLWSKTRDLASGKPIIMGDTLEDIWVLKDVNFEIKRGEIVGIIGRNGAGKSTLLKVLSRITEPSAGRVSINGRIASLLEVGTGFHPELTGRENIYLNGSILGMNRAEIKRKFAAIVDFAGVERFLDTPVKRYSSGMYVRLAFAVASHLEPEILLIDEVLAVGDMEFQKKCLGRMNEVAHDGRTVVFVSHSLPMISSLCSSCILLHSGKVVADGLTSEVVRQYQFGSDLNSARIDFVAGGKQPGDSHVRLLSAWVESTAGKPQLEFSLFDPIRVCIKFVVRQRLDVAPQPNLHVMDGSGSYVFVTSPHNWQSDVALEPGEYLATCQIPEHFLNDGMYSVGIALNRFENGLITAFFERHALSFNIVDPIEQNAIRAVSGWAGRVPGVVRPLLDWKLEASE